MPLHLFRKTCLLVVVASASLLAVPAKAQTWDLRTDWSNTVNPNGAWRYLVNGATATASTRGADSFGPPGPPTIWGSSYYGWSQSNGSEQFTYDLQVGDIYGHNNAGGPIEIDWTSPFTGLVNVSGGTWMLRDIGRANNWQVTLNNSVQAFGALYSGDQWDRANPATFTFSAVVQAGDVIEFSAVPPCCVGDYAGVNLTVTAVTTTPEPSSALLFGLGLGVVAPVVLRRKR